MRFYHATSTGPNLETLKSFLQHGVKTEQATGSGQGAGFYVWTTKERAIDHALKFLADFAQGYPLIITVEATLNTKDWDLDYELHPDLVFTFLYNNFELFKQIPDGAILMDGIPLVVSRCILNKEYKVIKFAIGGTALGGGKTKAMGCPDPRDSDVWTAATLGTIFNYMQVHFPAQAEKFEAAILKQELHAVKYVGKAPLKIVQCEAFVDNRWLDALTLLEK